MKIASLTRFAALLIIALLLALSAAEAGHHHEEGDVRHDCAMCVASSLTPLIGDNRAPAACPAPVVSRPPDPQGLPLCAPYHNCLPSRAPPVPA